MHLELSDFDGATICGDTLRPISDQEWTCVGHPAHEDDHLALDGTRW
ncbi:hypothetical protein [Pseudonocardia adelaidensis]|uniref:Transposase n=1 Tax=Pseudonocardia adelaidensis TaxID=648754 RepID=A0ABP9NSB1_9PSEU